VQLNIIPYLFRVMKTARKTTTMPTTTTHATEMTDSAATLSCCRDSDTTSITLASSKFFVSQTSS